MKVTRGGLRWSDRVVIRLLSSPLHRVMSGSVAVIRIRGVVTGRLIALPVQYARYDAGFVVVPGDPDSKRWWRNVRKAAPVELLVRGEWLHAEGRVLDSSDAEYERVRAAYEHRWPRIDLGRDNPVVRITVHA